MESYDWIADALVVFINGAEFQDNTSSFLRVQSNDYYTPTSNQSSKQKIFESYQAHFNKLVEDFFATVGLKKGQYEPAFDLIITSEEGFSDTRLASDFLASRDFNIFDLLMTYYLSQGLLIEVTSSEDPDDIYVQELLSNAELAEINLAIAISDAIEKKIEDRIKKTVIPSNPIPKPSSVSTIQTSPIGPTDDMFKKTGTSASSGPKQYTPVSSDALHAKKDKLLQDQSELTQKLASIREDQETRTRSLAPELAQKILEKRQKALAVQKQVQAKSLSGSSSSSSLKKKTAAKKK